MKTLKELQELRGQAYEKYDGCKTVEEVRAVDLEIEKLDRQITEVSAVEERNKNIDPNKKPVFPKGVLLQEWVK